MNRLSLTLNKYKLVQTFLFSYANRIPIQLIQLITSVGIVWRSQHLQKIHCKSHRSGKSLRGTTVRVGQVESRKNPREIRERPNKLEQTLTKPPSYTKTTGTGVQTFYREMNR